MARCAPSFPRPTVMRKISFGFSLFSLIELLMVLGIIAMLSVAAFVIYPRVAQARQQGMAGAGQTTENVDVPVVGLNDEQRRKIAEEGQRKREGKFHSGFENGF